MVLSGKVVLVTGGSSGIGKAICTYLSEKGYTVYGTSRNPEKIREKLPFTLLELDVKDRQSIRLAVQKIIDIEGKIDILVNNAGVGIMSAVEDVSETEIENVFDINLFGPVRVLKEVLPHMRRSKSGLVVQIASVAGHIALPYRGVYCGSKAALQKLTESLRMELKPYQIRVCVLDPGDFATSINENRIVAEAVKQQSSPYTSETLRIERLVKSEVSNSSDPYLIGKKIHQIALSQKVKVYYTVAKPIQRLALLVRRILPNAIFERIIEKKYGLKV